ncbi:MAG: hypothetical protein SGPRY_002990 [Prymnesium sp.]
MLLSIARAAAAPSHPSHASAVRELRANEARVLDSVSRELRERVAALEQGETLQAIKLASLLLIRPPIVSKPEENEQTTPTGAEGRAEEVRGGEGPREKRQERASNASGDLSTTARPLAALPVGALLEAQRGAIRALANLCLCSPSGSLAWAAALWALCHPGMPNAPLLQEYSLVSRACATALDCRGLHTRAAGGAAKQLLPPDLGSDLAAELQREMGEDVQRAIGTLLRLVGSPCATNKMPQRASGWIPQLVAYVLRGAEDERDSSAPAGGGDNLAGIALSGQIKSCIPSALHDMDAALMRSLKGPPLLAAIELLEVTSDKSEGGDDLFDAVWRVLCSGQALLLQQAEPGLLLLRIWGLVVATLGVQLGEMARRGALNSLLPCASAAFSAKSAAVRGAAYVAWGRLVRSWGRSSLLQGERGEHQSRLSLLSAPLRFAWKRRKSREGGRQGLQVEKSRQADAATKGEREKEKDGECGGEREDMRQEHMVHLAAAEAWEALADGLGARCWESEVLWLDVDSMVSHPSCAVRAVPLRAVSKMLQNHACSHHPRRERLSELCRMLHLALVAEAIDTNASSTPAVARSLADDSRGAERGREPRRENAEEAVGKRVACKTWEVGEAGETGEGGEVGEAKERSSSLRELCGCWIRAVLCGASDQCDEESCPLQELLLLLSPSDHSFGAFDSRLAASLRNELALLSEGPLLQLLQGEAMLALLTSLPPRSSRGETEAVSLAAASVCATLLSSIASQLKSYLHSPRDCHKFAQPSLSPHASLSLLRVCSALLSLAAGKALGQSVLHASLCDVACDALGAVGPLLWRALSEEELRAELSALLWGGEERGNSLPLGSTCAERVGGANGLDNGEPRAGGADLEASRGVWGNLKGSYSRLEAARRHGERGTRGERAALIGRPLLDSLLLWVERARGEEAGGDAGVCLLVQGVRSAWRWLLHGLEQTLPMKPQAGSSYLLGRLCSKPWVPQSRWKAMPALLARLCNRHCRLSWSRRPMPSANQLTTLTMRTPASDRGVGQ